MCPHYNIGYCKYKKKCSKVHAKVDCPDQKCQNKKCQQRHRKYCRYGAECIFKVKSTCEFKHENELHEKQMHSHNEKEKQLIAESKSLEEDIKQLLENAEKQKKYA